MSLLDYLQPGRQELRLTAKTPQIIEFLEKHPKTVNLNHSELAKIVKIDDIRITKKFLDRYRLACIEWFRLNDIDCSIDAVVEDIAEETFETATSTQSNDYDGLPSKQEDILSLKMYCEKYHIPYEYVTSAKFVNHTGQAAWNVVCDLSKMSAIYLDEYFDKLKSALTETIVPVKLRKKKIKEPVAYHFYHSDKHVGAKTKDTSLYDNFWNAEIFEQRLLATLDDYILSAGMLERFDKVLIADLGDSVDGWNGKTTRGGHQLPQNMNNKETFDVYARVMCKFMDSLIALDLANEYEFIAMSNDNHGGDFSYIVNRAVEIYLNVKYPQIKTSVREQFIDCYEYGNHVFMFTHGKDDTDMKFGLPLNLDQKTELTINEFIDDRKLHDNWLHFIKGDLHSEALNFGKKFRYRNVLSLFGSSSWSMLNYGKASAGASAEIVFKNRNKIVPFMTVFEHKQSV